MKPKPDRIAKGLWWDRAWTLVRGCSPVSDGCRNCWAAREAHMRQNRPNVKMQLNYGDLTTPEGKWNGKIRTVAANLELPLRARKPAVWAIWNDLFHESVEDEFIDHAFAVMLACHIWTNKYDHQFMILTKRPARMAEYFSVGPAELLQKWAKTADGWLICDDPDVYFSELVLSATCRDWDENGRNSKGSEYKPWGYINKLWPLPNVWLGVTAENQQAADERIPILLQTPAAVRFISVEPMLGPVDIEAYLPKYDYRPTYEYYRMAIGCDDKPILLRPGMDWVICGGESGPGARPVHPDWVRSLRDQAKAAGVPFFLKQMHIGGKLIKMPEIDGQSWVQFPEISHYAKIHQACDALAACDANGGGDRD